MANNNPNTATAISNLESMSTRVSLEANRLAALHIGGDASLSHPLERGSPTLDSKPVQPRSLINSVQKETGNPSQSRRHEGNWSSGWCTEGDAQPHCAGVDGRRAPPRIGLQRCDGTDIVSWLRMVKLHISSHKYSEEEWISEVPYYLEGGALALWWEVEERSKDGNKVTWSSFQQELMDRFCPRSEIEVVANLRQVKYKDDIRLYIQQFSEIVMRGRRPAEDVLLKLFLFGLPPDYFMALTEGGLKRYETLSAAMCKAREIFAPKEAAAVEYIESNPESARLLNQSSDPVFLRTLSKLGITAKSNDRQKDKYPERNRGSPPLGSDGQQQEAKGLRNWRQQWYQQRFTNTFIQKQQRYREIEKLLCKKCNGKGHEEQHCALQSESNRRPGQSCMRCGGNEHWARQCATPRWFKLKAKSQVNCVIGECNDIEESRLNDDA